MANQVDNITLVDSATGLARTINSSDDLFVSADLTLDGGAILVADNFKRFAGDPNGSVPGNIGDALFRTDTGQFYTNSNGTTTGWYNVSNVEDLNTTLAAGNTTGGADIILSSGDSILGEDNALGSGGDLLLTAGSSGGGGGSGGNVVLTPGSPAGGSNGIVQINGIRHYPASAADPTTPTPSAGDIYYNTTINLEMRYDASRSKWLSTETAVFAFGRSGNTTAGNYYRGINGSTLSNIRGWTALYNGTVVSVGYTKSDTGTSTLQVTASGATVASLLAPGVTSVESNTLNGDFTQGAVLAGRNAAGGSTTNAVQAWCVVKWRA